MPELPEVEIIRRFLEKSILRQTITGIKVLNNKSFDADPQQVINQKIIRFSRHGKQLSAHLSNKLILLFHLKMTGQLILTGESRTALGHPTPDMLTSSLPGKSTRVIFEFADKSTLYFNDQRKFGWIKLFSSNDLSEFQKGLGVDVLDDEFTPIYFQNQLSHISRPIKTVLLDQSKFAGIGNIYANDALFLAKIHPALPADNLTVSQSQKLHSFLVEIIKESISHGGSTAKDLKYLHPDGTIGSHQYHFRVYQREGESCPLCHTPIQRFKQSGRSSFFCPHCQKL